MPRLLFQAKEIKKLFLSQMCKFTTNFKIRAISYNCQSLRSKNHLVTSLFDMCEIFFLQETPLPENWSGVLDNLDDELVNDFVPVIPKYDDFVGRASGGLTIFAKKKGFITKLVHL